MKQYVFLFGLVSLFFSCNSGGNSAPMTGASIDLTGFETIQISGSNCKKVVKKDAAGKILEEGVICNGKRQGAWVTYHTDKAIANTIANFVNDLYSGPWYQLNNRGQIEEVRSYLNNQLDGRQVKYKFGRITEESGYKNGKLHGVYRSYFANTDKIQQEVNYNEGQMHGNFKYYNEEGAVTMEYEYKNGEKVSGGIVKE